MGVLGGNFVDWRMSGGRPTAIVLDGARKNPRNDQVVKRSILTEGSDRWSDLTLKGRVFDRTEPMDGLVAQVRRSLCPTQRHGSPARRRLVANRAGMRDRSQRRSAKRAWTLQDPVAPD